MIFAYCLGVREDAELSSYFWERVVEVTRKQERWSEKV